MTDQLEHIPQRDEVVSYKNLDFIVQDADSRCVRMARIVEHELAPAE